jgi:hypothetical protein
VGFYDIDQIEFEPLAGVLTLTGGIPIFMKLHVARLEVEVRSLV